MKGWIVARSGLANKKMPIRRTRPGVCWAPTVSGHMAAPPTSPMNFRRRIVFPRAKDDAKLSYSISEAKQEIQTETGLNLHFAPREDRAVDVRFGSWPCKNALGI